MKSLGELGSWPIPPRVPSHPSNRERMAYSVMSNPTLLFEVSELGHPRSKSLQSNADL